MSEELFENEGDETEEETCNCVASQRWCGGDWCPEDGGHQHCVYCDRIMNSHPYGG